MHKYVVLAVLSLLMAGAASAQRSTTLPPSTETDVVKISTNLIQLDVTVTDRNGKPVTDIKPTEVEVYENGEKQNITAFSFVSSGRVARSENMIARKKSRIPEPPLPPVNLRPENVKRTFALVVDDLALSWESVHRTRQALKKFVDEQMQQGDLVAIVRTGSGVGALQQFTSDKRILHSAIDKIKWNMMGSGGISAFTTIEPTPLEMLQMAGDTSITEEDLADERNKTNSETALRTSKFAAGTLGAIAYVINGMSELPARKFVVLFSDGFPISVRDRWGESMPAAYLASLRHLIDTANRASVVIYAVDPRGLLYTGLTAADSIISADPRSIGGKLAERRRELFSTQEGLAYLSHATGGFTITNNNNLNFGLNRVLDDQSYYLVGYEPDSETFDPVTRRFNTISVKVLRKDVEVRYRSGFFNVADTKRIPVAEKLSPLMQLEKALYSPFGITGVNIRLNTLFGSDASNTAFVRSLLHIEARDLTFTDKPDGQKTAAFDVLAASFGENGRLIDQLGKSYELTVPPDVYRRIMDEGFVYHFKFPVKTAGAYQYRVAIRDSVRGEVGSANQFIEVPDLKKERLTLSSIVVENLTVEQYQQSFDITAPLVATDPMTDTALRRARVGSVLRYGFEIYNARLDAAKAPGLTTRVRVFREGKLVLDGTQKPFELLGQTDMKHLKSFGAIAIGRQMEPGDYVLQVIVTDALAKPKYSLASQFVPFEVIP